MDKGEEELITDEKELLTLFLDIEQRCMKLENFEEPGMSVEDMIEKLQTVLRSIKQMQLFSPNESIKEIHTEHLK